MDQNSQKVLQQIDEKSGVIAEKLIADLNSPSLQFTTEDYGKIRAAIIGALFSGYLLHFPVEIQEQIRIALQNPGSVPA